MDVPPAYCLRRARDWRWPGLTRIIGRMSGFKIGSAVLQTPLLNLRQEVVGGAGALRVVLCHLEEALLDVGRRARDERVGLRIALVGTLFKENVSIAFHKS